MNPKELQRIRQALLLQLQAAFPAAITTEFLARGLTEAGFGPERITVQRELTYLQEKGLVSEDASPLSPALKRWRLTADGNDVLDATLAM